METNVRYTVAGVFVLSMLLLIIFCVIWISSGISTEDYSYYTVYMKESVSGLSSEGPVEFNGVDVGKIDKMSIDKENPQTVILLLKIKSDTPVTVGTRAKLGIRALSGNTYILLEDKGTNKTPLVSKDNKPPVINTSPSILVRLDTTLTQMNSTFNQLSSSFRQLSNSVGSLLSNENVAYIRILLRKLSGVAPQQQAQPMQR